MPQKHLESYYNEKPKNSLVFLLFPGLVLFGLGFAPIGGLFEALGKSIGVYYEIVLSVLLISRYQVLRKNWLFLICSLPWCAVTLGWFKMSPYGNLFWILKIIPLIYSFNYEKQHLSYRYHKISRIIVPFAVVLLVMHVLACGWLLIEKPYAELNYTAYNKAFYWVVATLTTVGYGDITPTSNFGRIYASAVMLLGIGVYGLVISNMSRLIIQQDRRREETHKKMDQLGAFFNHYKIPVQLQDETRAFYNHILSKKIYTQEKELLADIPTKLKNELQIHMMYRPIAQSKLFRGLSINDMRDVLSKLENSYVSPGEIVYNQGDESDSMYIIAHGHVEIYKDTGPVASLATNHVFGEMSMVLGEVRSATAKASTYLDLIKLSKANFQLLTTTHPKIKENIDEIIKSRLRG